MALKISYLWDPVTIEVGTSAAKLGAGTGGDPNSGRQFLKIYNDGSSVVYLGNSNVTNSGQKKGIPLEPGELEVLEMSDKCNYYAIAESGTVNIIVQEAK